MLILMIILAVIALAIFIWGLVGGNTYVTASGDSYNLYTIALIPLGLALALFLWWWFSKKKRKD
jgi:NADH:ubiquinone oxidoreductase subunit 6 (subunit J)